MNDDDLIRVLSEVLPPDDRQPPASSLSAFFEAVDLHSRRSATRSRPRLLVPAAALLLVVAAVALVATRGDRDPTVDGRRADSTVGTVADPRADLRDGMATLDAAVTRRDLGEVRRGVERVLRSFASLSQGDQDRMRIDVAAALERANRLLVPAPTSTFTSTTMTATSVTPTTVTPTSVAPNVPGAMTVAPTTPGPTVAPVTAPPNAGSDDETDDGGGDEGSDGDAGDAPDEDDGGSGDGGNEDDIADGASD